jgi:hypothetical protein
MPFSTAVWMDLDTSDDSSTTAFQGLPPHLQHLIYASAAAPLTTCKASAAIAQDASLTAAWLLAKKQQPLQTAVKHQLWDVCNHLLSTHQYRPETRELRCCLIDSAQQGATAVVAALLQWCCRERHKSSQCTCTALYTALMRAAANGHVAVCHLLLQHPCITGQDVRWAVTEAAAAGHLDVLHLLITSRPDAASPDLFGSPMQEAASIGNFQAMQFLLQHGADINATPGTPWGEPYHIRTPLCAAVVQGHAPATVEWMLEQGANAGPALATAARIGNLPVLRKLLDWGADINTWGGLAFRSALCECQTEAACLLLGAGPPDYFMSAAPPHPGMGLDDIDHLVSNYVHKGGHQHASTLLQTAVQHGHTEFAQMLQEQGVALPAGQRHGPDRQQEGF